MCYYCPCCRRCDCGCRDARNNKSDFRPPPPGHNSSTVNQMNYRNTQISPSRCRYCRCTLACQCDWHFDKDGRLPRPLRCKTYLTPALYSPYNEPNFNLPNNHSQAHSVSQTPGISTEASVCWPSVTFTCSGTGWFSDSPYSDREGLLSPGLQTRERFMIGSFERGEKSTARVDL